MIELKVIHSDGRSALCHLDMGCVIILGIWKISPNIYQKIQTLSLKAHQAIGCRGVSRSDFRYDDRHSENGELIWLEINTQPGMTPTSLVPEIAVQAGHSFGELLSWMVEDASCLR